MTRIAKAVIILSCTAAPSAALAADIARTPYVKAPPLLAVTQSWAGFYLGVHGGYGWSRNSFTETVQFLVPPQSINGIKSDGAVFGAHAGYNWQFGRAVAGVEFDLSAATIAGRTNLFQTATPAPGTFSSLANVRSDDVKYLGSARARFGWAPLDNVLVYGTGGLAWERYERASGDSFFSNNGQITNITVGITTPSDRFGWVAGAGVETRLWDSNWIGRVEYLHYGFGAIDNASTFSQTINNNATINRAGEQSIDIVRAGLSYKFGEPSNRVVSAYAQMPGGTMPASWAGFYLGAHGGYAWADNAFMSQTSTENVAGYINGFKSKGAVAGAHAGYNWQYDRVVAGFEVDLSAADIKGNSATVTLFDPGGTTQTGSYKDKVGYLGTLRARLGWTPLDNVLLYGTAGLAWERIERTTNFALINQQGFVNTFINTTPADRFGWVAGAGVESKLFGTNWIGRLEYLHYDFGKISNVENFVIVQPPPASSNSATASKSGSQTIDVVRAGVSYKFGEPAGANAYAQMRPGSPAQTWAGFYVGAHGGYGWKENDFTEWLGGTSYLGGIKSRGWIAGGQTGRNWQYGSIVAGLELDMSATGIKGSSAPARSNNITVVETWSDNVKYLGTARGRLGWTPVANTLLYGTGGLAWERAERGTLAVNTLVGNTTTSTTTTARDHFGWVAGVGAEVMLGNPNWIGRVEYLHYDFGSVDQTRVLRTTNPGVTPSTEREGRQTIDVVRAGISYKFTP